MAEEITQINVGDVLRSAQFRVGTVTTRFGGRRMAEVHLHRSGGMDDFIVRAHRYYAVVAVIDDADAPENPEANPRPARVFALSLDMHADDGLRHDKMGGETITFSFHRDPRDQARQPFRAELVGRVDVRETVAYLTSNFRK